MTTWGRWRVSGGDGARLDNGDGWGIPLDRFKRPMDLRDWQRHVSGKGWGDAATLVDMADAFVDLNGSGR